MSDEEKNAVGVDASSTNDVPKRRSWSLVRILLLFIAFAFLGLGGLSIWTYYRFVKAPIDVDNATTTEALGWLALRDLSEESDQKRDELFDMYFSTIEANVSSNGDLSLDIPEEIKEVSASIMSERNQKTVEWKANWKRPPYLRLDYIIKSSPERKGAYIVSSDVVPGPSLVSRWDAERTAHSNQSMMEKNINLLVLQWFTSKYNEYDATPDEEKSKKLGNLVVEMFRLQTLYNSFRGATKQAELGRVEMLGEFESTIDGWNGLAPIEQVAKALWFKDLLETAAAQSMNVLPKTIKSEYPEAPRFAESSDDASSVELAKGVGTLLKKALDASKKYLFKDAEE